MYDLKKPCNIRLCGFFVTQNICITMYYTEATLPVMEPRQYKTKTPQKS